MMDTSSTWQDQVEDLHAENEKLKVMLTESAGAWSAKQDSNEALASELKSMHSDFKHTLNDTFEQRERAQKDKMEKLKQAIRQKAKQKEQMEATLGKERKATASIIAGMKARQHEHIQALHTCKHQLLETTDLLNDEQKRNRQIQKEIEVLKREIENKDRSHLAASHQLQIQVAEWKRREAESKAVAVNVWNDMNALRESLESVNEKCERQLAALQNRSKTDMDGLQQENEALVDDNNALRAKNIQNEMQMSEMEIQAKLTAEELSLKMKESKQLKQQNLDLNKQLDEAAQRMQDLVQALDANAGQVEEVCSERQGLRCKIAELTKQVEELEERKEEREQAKHKEQERVLRELGSAKMERHDAEELHHREVTAKNKELEMLRYNLAVLTVPTSSSLVALEAITPKLENTEKECEQAKARHNEEMERLRAELAKFKSKLEVSKLDTESLVERSETAHKEKERVLCELNNAETESKRVDQSSQLLLDEKNRDRARQVETSGTLVITNLCLVTRPGRHRISL